MNQIKLIARREWQAIIYSPAGLALTGLYLLLTGYLFSMTVTLTHEATLRYAFSSFGVLTILVVPILTMRLLAEELRTGTFEVLTTHPVTDVQIVLGKFVAGWAAFLLLSLPTLGYLVILQAFGSPDWGPALSGYLGQQLLAGMLVALGLMVSALTSSQVLAAMVALIGGLLLALAGTAAQSLRGVLGEALAYLAVLEHFALFRRGVLDTRALIYFLATTGMFLYLAVRAVESRRWKFGTAPSSPSAKWARPRLSLILAALALLSLGETVISRATGGTWTSYNTALLVAAGALMIALAWLNRNWLRYQIARHQTTVALTVLTNSVLVILTWSLVTFLTSRHYFRADLTRAKHYALSDQTRQVLAQLSVPIEVVVVTTAASDLRQEIDDLFSEYKARSSRLSVRSIDPLQKPGELEETRHRYKLTTPLSEEILVAAAEKVRRIPVASLVRQVVGVAEGHLVRGPVQFMGEAELTAALIQLTRKAPGRVAFLAGHAEKNPDDTGKVGALTVAAELRRNGWVVDKHIVTPGAQASFPPETAVAIVAGPAKQLSDEDVKALTEVVDRGGGLLFLLEPGVDAGVEAFLSAWNVRLSDNLVVDLQDHLASADPTSLYVTRFSGDHPIGKGMGQLAAVLPTARRIAVSYQANPQVMTRNFMHTSGTGWAVPYRADGKFEVDQQRDRSGPISLGMACERLQEFAEPGHPPLQGRIVVIGDSDFITNQYVDMAGNLNLFLNCIDWLSGRQDLISVRPKVVDMQMMALTPHQAKLIFWLSVLGVPGVAVLGLGTAMRRRKLKA